MEQWLTTQAFVLSSGEAARWERDVEYGSAGSVSLACLSSELLTFQQHESTACVSKAASNSNNLKHKAINSLSVSDVTKDAGASTRADLLGLCSLILTGK